ncbi:MAG: hypothetical protein M5U33_13300 [Pseudorhodoplanes sp.]|nr:hypothetical protein [Pseudorhodoplanes sp.]
MLVRFALVEAFGDDQAADAGDRHQRAADEEAAGRRRLRQLGELVLQRREIGIGIDAELDRKLALAAACAGEVGDRVALHLAGIVRA